MTAHVAGCAHGCRQGAGGNAVARSLTCLIVFFVALPHLRIGGKPPILLDIAARKFVFRRSHVPAHRHVAAGTGDGRRFRHDRVGHGLCRTRLVRMGMSANGLHGVSVSADRSFFRGHGRQRWETETRPGRLVERSPGFSSISCFACCWRIRSWPTSSEPIGLPQWIRSLADATSHRVPGDGCDDRA